MSNIAEFLQKILSARYGKDVRQSIHDAIEEVDKVADTAQNSATKAAEAARESEQASSLKAQEAEAFRNEAEQFRNEAALFTPDNYAEFVQTATDTKERVDVLEENMETVSSEVQTNKSNIEKVSFKVDTVIEKADLRIKETASGESIHLTDSADAKVVEFGLYGKATQKTTTGKNLLENIAVSKTENGLTFVVNEDKSIKVTGTTTAQTDIIINGAWGSTVNLLPNTNGKIIVKGSGSPYVKLYVVDNTTIQTQYDSDIILDLNDENSAIKKVTDVFYRFKENINYNLTLYPMIRACDENGNPIGDDTYEPYTGGIPSPNPDYPQNVEVAGSSGNVVVKTCGKNLLKNTATTQAINGVTFTVNDDGSVTANGTATVTTDLYVYPSTNWEYENGEHILSGCPSGGNSSTYCLYFFTESQRYLTDIGNSIKSTINKGERIFAFIRINNGINVQNLTFYPMIRIATDTDDTYEPYKETSSTIPTPNGLGGVDVDSGGNYTDENGQMRIADVIYKYVDGSGEYIQKIGKKFLSTANWTHNNGWSNANAFVADGFLTDAKHVEGYATEANLISNRFIVKTPASLASNQYGIGQGNKRALFVAVEGITTASDLKQYFADNETYVYYELAEPIRTPLTAEHIAEIEKLCTFYPVTNIYNDVDCGMKVTYQADSKNYIDKQLDLQKQAQEAAMINMLLLLPEETQAAMIENDTNNLLLESEV